MRFQWRQSQFRIVDDGSDDGAGVREFVEVPIDEEIDAHDCQALILDNGRNATLTLLGGAAGVATKIKHLRVAISHKLNGDQKRIVRVAAIDGDDVERTLAYLIADANSDEAAAVEIVNNADPERHAAANGYYIKSVKVYELGGFKTRLNITAAGNEA